MGQRAARSAVRGSRKVAETRPRVSAAVRARPRPYFGPGFAPWPPFLLLPINTPGLLLQQDMQILG